MRKRHFTFDNQCSRKYHLNESFFEKIDCQEKAYFLGFIFADGSISKIEIPEKMVASDLGLPYDK
jgi:hypothetical protein